MTNQPLILKISPSFDLPLYDQTQKTKIYLFSLLLSTVLNIKKAKRGKKRGGKEVQGDQIHLLLRKLIATGLQEHYTNAPEEPCMGAFRCLVPVGSVIRGKCISDSSLLVHSNSKGRGRGISYVVCRMSYVSLLRRIYSRPHGVVVGLTARACLRALSVAVRVWTEIDIPDLSYSLQRRPYVTSRG